MATFTDWHGLVSGRTDSYDSLNLIAVTIPGMQTWATPFRGIADDGHEYFIKTLDGCKKEWTRGSLAVEYIVGQAGKLIGAPVCDNALIRIPTGLPRRPSQASPKHLRKLNVMLSSRSCVPCQHRGQ
ncbi:hypothetical protein ACIBI7_21040 [Nonomuraea fuscirosea]|uniref:hypothetical protein n=1 Tax=Nonomuraea fuscirosea TaxID=1291556 RepID=UPI0037A76931